MSKSWPDKQMMSGKLPKKDIQPIKNEKFILRSDYGEI